MNSKEIIEFIKDIKELDEVYKIDSDISYLRRFERSLSTLKPLIKSGEIANAVNIVFKDYSSRYNEKFFCNSDDEYHEKILEVINYLNNVAADKVCKKIAEKLEKREKVNNE